MSDEQSSRDLLAQLEADRHRMQAEIRRLEARVAQLEKYAPPED